MSFSSLNKFIAEECIRVRILTEETFFLRDQVNRDPLAAEMQRMRQQLELMQAELLCARAGGPSSTEVQA